MPAPASLAAARSGSKLGAVLWRDSGGLHLRVYCNTRGSAMQESCNDGQQWYDGQFVLQTQG
jgi:hypothetical protein